jgi:S-adenosylmethionine hydrolase
MLVLCTDFGPGGPYTGQMQAVLAREAPGVPVISLFEDLPAGQVKSAAYLLPAYCSEFPLDSVFVCVVDPGVGTDSREPAVIRADGRWFVGPDNGLLAIIARRARQLRSWRISWRPRQLSASFHGRDLFAPVAAMLARGEPVPGEPGPLRGAQAEAWPEELAEIIYIDPFGNAMTGIRANSLQEPRCRLLVGQYSLGMATTFGDVSAGEAFYYANANGLLEIAVNRGHAARQLDLAVGDSLRLA